MSDQKKIDKISGTETTGHEWDGIEELNTPMPRWWLWTFYACIVWAVVYAVLMPSIPLLNSHFKGVLGQSDRANVAAELSAMQEARSQNLGRLTNASLEQIESDPELLRYALAAGRSAFGDNCATCHGSGAQGFKGYPNLNDDVWLWGGEFDQIRNTITVGIRAGHEDTQINLMQAYGTTEFLTREEIEDISHYVRTISGQESGAEQSASAEQLFANNCASCHNDDGTGDKTAGVPNLTDNEWLYGGGYDDIYQTIYSGRAGVMPNWDERLSPEMITALSYYVHSLGGGERPANRPAAAPRD